MAVQEFPANRRGSGVSRTVRRVQSPEVGGINQKRHPGFKSGCRSLLRYMGPGREVSPYSALSVVCLASAPMYLVAILLNYKESTMPFPTVQDLFLPSRNSKSLKSNKPIF
jgi:hypothetical protein